MKGLATVGGDMNDFHDYRLHPDARVDFQLQQQIERIDRNLREKHGLSSDQAAVGVLDLKTVRLSLLHPFRLEYGASIPKIAILLAFLEIHPELIRELPPQLGQELGLMIKSSSNEAAARFSRELGLQQIQNVLQSYGFYDLGLGGGIWIGKHYGVTGERFGDPIGDHSHAVNVFQLLRFYLLLEQGKLISSAASRLMREIFSSPDLPHDPIKFVKGLSGRPCAIRRKWGSWENWLHDSAVIEAADRHYILVGLTHHPNGDAYLEELALAVDDLLRG